MKYPVQAIRVAAIYKMGALRRFDRDTLIGLLVDRAKMQPSPAKILVSHWLTTEHFRPRRPEENETSNDYVGDNGQFGMGA